MDLRSTPPRYAVLIRTPMYDERDGLCGSRTVVHPYRFHTLAAARAVPFHDPEELSIQVVDAATLQPLRSTAPVGRMEMSSEEIPF